MMDGTPNDLDAPMLDDSQFEDVAPAHKQVDAPARRPKGQPAAPATDEPHDELTDLSLATGTLFDKSFTEPTLSNGRKPKVRPATMEHLGLIIDFFKDILGAIDQKQMSALVQLIVAMQTKNIVEGKDPNQIDLSLLTSEDVVTKAFGQASVLLTMFAACANRLPKLAAAFSDVSEAEYKKLEVDDGVLLTVAIVVVNYGFFTRRLPPILTGFIRSWAAAKNMHG
jgi:hypothetical protein